MVEQALTDEISSILLADESPLDDSPGYDDDYLADRCMFLKGFDLLDIDHGHFWYKISWHGVHVEFPSRLHHYEPNLYERHIRDYLLSLPAAVLDDAFKKLQDQPAYTVCDGDHCFVFEWDDEEERHLHCYYERSAEGRAKDQHARESHVQKHVEQYEKNRQFPSKRLNAELVRLKAQRAKAQQAVEAWDRMILSCQERMAQDEILHLGHATHVAR